MTTRTAPTNAQVARTAGIAPRTKRFQLTDEYGLRYGGSRAEHVLAALCRSDKTPDLDSRTRVIANAIYKSLTTGRMNPGLAVRLTADYSPYRVCALVAHVARMYEGDPTIGHIADTWLNQHAAEL